MSFLELRHVSKIYGEGPTEVQALQDVSVSVDAGELVAVMGPSGSGKSTLLTIAGSLEEPTSGYVLVGGATLSKLSRAEKARLRRRIDRLRVPGLQPAARADRGGERLAAAGARRAHREKGPRRRHRGSRRARADRAGGALPRRALRRRAAAGRDRTRDSWQPQAGPRRRAVRRARLGERGDGDADAGCRLPPRRGHGGRHPRRAARLVGGPGGVHQGRPHRRPDHAAGEPRVAAPAGLASRVGSRDASQ